VPLEYALLPENRLGAILHVDIGSDHKLEWSADYTKIEQDGAVLPADPGKKGLSLDGLGRCLGYLLYGSWWWVYSLSQEWRLRFRPRLHPCG